MLLRFRQTLSVDAPAKTNNYNWGMFKCYIRLIRSITPKWLVKKDNWFMYWFCTSGFRGTRGTLPPLRLLAALWVTRMELAESRSCMNESSLFAVCRWLLAALLSSKRRRPEIWGNHCYTNQNPTSCLYFCGLKALALCHSMAEQQFRDEGPAMFDSSHLLLNSTHDCAKINWGQYLLPGFEVVFQ